MISTCFPFLRPYKNLIYYLEWISGLILNKKTKKTLVSTETLLLKQHLSDRWSENRFFLKKC